MNFEEAKQYASEAFLARHPLDTLPSWVNNVVTIGGFKNQGKGWTIRYTAAPATPLEPNQMWEEKRGRKVLVEIDEITGEKMIVLCRTGVPPVVLFEATIDPKTCTSSVTVDVDLTAFNGDEFETQVWQHN